LKDEIARLGKPSGLKALQDLVATLDQCYWERQTEINWDKKTASASTSNNKPTSSDKSSAGQQSNSGNKQDNRQQQGKKDQKKPASTSTPATPVTPDKNSIANLLGPDGKLKPEERQCRMDNKLCLRCGKAGHTVPDCPTKSKAKGRAGTATPATAPAATSGSGKGWAAL